MRRVVARILRNWLSRRYFFDSLQE